MNAQCDPMMVAAPRAKRWKKRFILTPALDASAVDRVTLHLPCHASALDASNRLAMRLRSPAMDLKLKDRTCLVTGASRGIGRGIAKVLAAEGCRVAVVARR